MQTLHLLGPDLALDLLRRRGVSTRLPDTDFWNSAKTAALVLQRPSLDRAAHLPNLPAAFCSVKFSIFRQFVDSELRACEKLLEYREQDNVDGGEGSEDEDEEEVVSGRAPHRSDASRGGLSGSRAVEWPHDRKMIAFCGSQRLL